MNLERIYIDQDGNECNILQMVKRCPEWAANRIQATEKNHSINAIIIRALRRFKEVLDSLECQCDEYVGYTCTLHDDIQIVDEALSEIDIDVKVIKVNKKMSVLKERICKNCIYWVWDKEIFTATGWTGMGREDGHCHYEPKRIFSGIISGDTVACYYFETKES